MRVQVLGFAAFLAVLVAFLGPACGVYVPPKTFAYIPADADPDLVLDLRTDICVQYAPRATWNSTRKEMSLSLAYQLSAMGKMVYLVVGHNMNYSEPGTAYDEVNDSITCFLPYLKGIIIGDDVMSKGNLTTLNIVAQWVAGNWSDLLDIGVGLDPHASTDDMERLDLGPYSFICTYYYTQVNISHHYLRFSPGQVPSLVISQTDQGNAERLKAWVGTIKGFSEEHGIAVWFMLAAFSDGQLVCTDRQMETDLDAVKGQGFEAIGWFTTSIVGSGKAAVFVGDETAGPYDWIAYYNLKSRLVDRAREPTSSELLEEISLLRDDVTELARDLDDAVTRLDAAADLIFQLALQTAALDHRLDALNRSVLDLAGGQTIIASNLRTLLRNLTSLGDAVANLAEEIDLLKRNSEQDIARLSDDLRNLGTRLDSIIGMADGLSLSTARMNQSLTAWLGSVTNLAMNLSVSTAALNRSLASLAWNITELTHAQASISSDLVGLIQAKEVVEEALTIVTKEVALLKQDRDETLASLNLLGQDLEELDNKRRQDKNDILLAIVVLGAAFLAVNLCLVSVLRRSRQVTK